MAFGSLTGFFGTNSSGKSSILQFLLMLKQTVESSDRSLVLNMGEASSYVELGTLPDVIFKNAAFQQVSFDLEWRIYNFRWINREKESLDVIDNISLHAEVVYLNNFTFSKNFTYRVKENQFGMVLHSNPAQHDYDRKKLKYLFTVGDKPRQQKLSGEYLFSNPIKFYGFPNDVYTSGASTVSDVVNMPVYEFEEFFERVFYLGPLREYPSRTYVWAGEQPQSVGNRGERTVAALLSSRNQGPTIDMGEGQPKRTVEEHVAHWLKELGLIYSFKVQPIAPGRKEYEVRIQRTAESASVFLTDVGFGVSQILPVLVLLFYVPEGSTVILEQPEIHLHPAVQAGLADVFIDAIKRRKLQIILESHSEHLLQRLQLRMAEKGLNPAKEFDSNEARLYFTSIEQGRSKLTPLALDKYGNINNWPDGFFGDTLGEAAAMLQAEMQRKMHQQ